MYRPGVPLRVQADGFELAMLRLPLGRAAAVAEQQTGIDEVDVRFEAMAPVSRAMSRPLEFRREVPEGLRAQPG